MTDQEGVSLTTILFTDVEGSTDLSTRAGDQVAQDLLHAHEAIVREHVAAQGGREVKALGDGFMLAFPSARHAVECAVAVQVALGELNAEANGHGIQVRMGLHAGEVFERAGDLFGTTVNLAARIVAKARGGQILASDAVKEMAVDVPTTYVDRGLFWLKGIPERQRLYEVVWRAGATPVAVGAGSALRTSFVGREPEMADLRRFVEETAEGRGALVLIGGEPGVGKTRLSLEAAEDASQFGVMAMVGRSYEMETSTPYLPVVEIVEASTRLISRETLREALGETASEIARLTPELRRLYPDLPPPLDLPPEQARRFLFNNVWEFLDRASRMHPLVLVLDDLHWADESTLSLVEFLAERLGEMRVLMIGTYRDVELDVTRPLARTMEALVRRRLAHRISLKRLPVEQVGDMLEQLAGQPPPEGLVELIYSETEGLPFFVEEVFEHLSEEGKLFDDDGRFQENLVLDELDVPESVRLVIGRRLERLNERSREVLAAAAVIGRRFPVQVLEGMGAASEDDVLNALEEAELSRLLTSSMESSGPVFEFGHELIRQTLLTGLSILRRQRLHGQAADALEQLHASALKEHAAEISSHLSQAGSSTDTLKLAGYLALAGDRAMEQAAFEEALDYYENGLDLVNPDDHHALAIGKEKRGQALQSLGRVDEALASWGEALDLYEEAGATEALVNLSVFAATLLGWGSRWAEAVQMSQRGLVAGMGEANPLRARLLAIAGVLISLAGSYAEGDALIEEARSIAQKVGDDGALGEALSAKAVHHWGWTEMRQCVEVGVPAADLLRRTGKLWELATALPFVEWAQTYTGREAEAQRIYDELEPLARKLGHHGSLAFALRDAALREQARTPDLAVNEAFARADLELSHLAGDGIFLAQSHSWLGAVKFQQGHWEEGLAELEMGSKTEADIPGVFTGISLGAELQYRGYADPEGTRRIVDATRTRLPVPGHPMSWGSLSLLLAHVDALPQIGSSEQAGALYPQMRDVLERGILYRPFSWIPVEALVGVAAGCAGEWEAAEGHFVATMEWMDQHELVFPVPDVVRLHAETLLRRGEPTDVERARELLHRAIDDYRRFRMPKHVELCERMLASA